MIKEDIIRMAREAGFTTLSINEDLWGPYLERFAALVAAPSPWVGLTEEEVTELSAFVYAGDPQYIRLIEAKLKEKNT